MLGLVVIGVLGLMIGSSVLGALILRSMFRRPAPPDLPTARDANPGIRRRALGKIDRGADVLARALVFVVAGTLLLGPWVLAYIVSTADWRM